MESSSPGKREKGTKVVTVKLRSKKVGWRLSKIYQVSVNKEGVRASCLRVSLVQRVEDNGRIRYYISNRGVWVENSL